VGLAEAETQTTTAERECLVRHAAAKMCLVEIGVWHGVTTRALRKAMAPDGVLFAVDPFPVGRLGFSMQRVIARREVSCVANGTVEWLRVTGVEAARLYATWNRRPAEFVFIDADHRYEAMRGDWQAWNSLVTAGGIIALHDSRSSATRNIDGTGSVMFTRDVVRHDPRFTIIEEVDTLTVLERTSE
jgi:predicted O-methyltransferase YrrM